MLSLPSRLGSDLRPVRHWKTVSAGEAAGLISSGVTIGVGWLGDALAAAIAEGFRVGGQPAGVTIVYGQTHGDGRIHGLNLLAHAGLVRRVVGGQWHPVPGLQALASANRLFRDIAEGLPGHLSRSGLGTFTDPRNGGGRLNRRTREQLVRLVRPAGDEALLFRSFPINVAVVGVAFMEGSGGIAMTRESMTIARAARRGGGLVIAQMDRIGTLEKLPRGQLEVPETLVDILVEAAPGGRRWETFGPAVADGGRRISGASRLASF
jgi:propionate CoA-transferase